MNKSTGATAVVPGSHKHVEHINEMRQEMWQHDDTKEKGTREWWQSRTWAGKGKPGDFHEPFTSVGLVPSVTNVKAGDMVIFDTALYHSGCPSEDPSGTTGHGTDHLLRAIFIMGMTPTRLKTPQELHARRMAYELDFEWYPDHHHAGVTAKSFAEHPSQNGPEAQPIVRRCAFLCISVTFSIVNMYNYPLFLAIS